MSGWKIVHFLALRACHHRKAPHRFRICQSLQMSHRIQSKMCGKQRQKLHGDIYSPLEALWCCSRTRNDVWTVWEWGTLSACFFLNEWSQRDRKKRIRKKKQTPKPNRLGKKQWKGLCCSSSSGRPALFKRQRVNFKFVQKEGNGLASSLSYFTTSWHLHEPVSSLFILPCSS